MIENPIIYTLSDPRAGEVKYVGKTYRREKRHRDHCSCVNSNERTKKINWIKSLAKLGLKPVMEVLEETTHENWQECERFWIETLRFLGCNLVNGDNGGLGAGKCLPETREKMSKAAKVFTNTPEFKASVSKCHKGRKRSLETCARIKTRRMNKDWHEKAMAKQRGSKRSPKAVENIRKAASDPVRREKVSRGIRKAYEDNPLLRLNASEKSKKQWENPAFREFMSKRMTGKVCSTETRMKMSISKRKLHQDKNLVDNGQLQFA